MRARIGALPALLLGLGAGMSGCQPAVPLLPTQQAFSVQATGSPQSVPTLGLMERTLLGFGLGLSLGPTGIGLSDLITPPLGGWSHVARSLGSGGHQALAHAPHGSTGSRLTSSGAITPFSGLGNEPVLPGWGNRTWGAGGNPLQAGFGQASQPGMFNLSRGAAQISGLGLDGGFFTIPQEEISKQMRAQLQAIDQSRTGIPGQGQTGLDPAKFPFLKQIKGPLIPPT